MCAQVVALVALLTSNAYGTAHVVDAESDGDSPTQEQMAAARNAVEVAPRNLVWSPSAIGTSEFFAYDIDGNMYEQNSTGGRALWPGQDTSLTFTALNITGHSMNHNNLGGMGPFNGELTFLSRELWGDACADSSTNPADRDCRKDPNFINFEQVGTSPDGQHPVSMRIDNSTIYEPANPAINYFHGDPFQINLRPIYNPLAGQYADSDAGAQPFAPGSIFTESNFGSLASTAQSVMASVLQSMHLNYRAENGNSVNLYFQFYESDTGAPVELEEVRDAC